MPSPHHPNKSPTKPKGSRSSSSAASSHAVFHQSAGLALKSSASQLHTDGPFFSELKSNFRTISSSVARACVGLPQFFSSPGAQSLGNMGPSMG